MSDDIGAGLGDGLSRLGDDEASVALRDGGYEITDFAGAFTPGARFRVSVGVSGTRVVKGPLEAERVGSLRVTTGRLTTFDPLDTARIDKSLLKLDREVPVGEHSLFVSRHGAEVVAAVVRFAGAAPVAWTPAGHDELDADPPEEPAAPPRAADDPFDFFSAAPRRKKRRRMSPATRLALGLGDARRVDEIMAEVMRPQSIEEVNKMRALFGGGPVGPGDPILNKKLPRGSHPGLDALRSALGDAAAAACDGLVAVRHDTLLSSFWGLDAHGDVVALACDPGTLRVRGAEVIDVALVDLHLSLRMRAGGVTLYDHPSHVLLDAPRGVALASVVLVIDGQETSPAMRVLPEGTRTQYELSVPSAQRTRGILRMRIGGPDRPATRF